jgi:transcriptional regulator with XRE-family HTH domain
MSISQRIKKLLVENNLSQKEMAVILKVDASQFSKIVSGKLQPTLIQLMEISSFFKVSLDWICFGREFEANVDFNINYKELSEARKEIIDMQRKMIQRLEQDKNDSI